MFTRRSIADDAEFLPIGERGDEIFLRPVALDAIAVGAEELEVVQMVGPAAAAGDYVVNLEYPEGELGLAAVAAAFLPSEEDVLVLAVYV